MKAELQQKYYEKQKLKREMIKLSTQLKSYVSTIIFNALNKSIKQKAEIINKCHHKKINKT